MTSLTLKDMAFSDAGAKDMAQALEHENNQLTSLGFPGGGLINTGALEIVGTVRSKHHHLTGLESGGFDLTDAVTEELLQVMQADVGRFTFLGLWSEAFT